MSEISTPHSSKIDRTTDLANSLLSDIKQRRLIKGDRYLTTEQVGHMLRVSKASANLAMQMLTKKDILVRKQRKGTFIGSAIDSTGEFTNGQAMKPSLEAICVVLLPDRTIPATQIVAGIHEGLPGMDVHFIFLPEERPVEFIRDRVACAKAAGQRHGYLLISCSRKVYRFFAEQDVPVAVSGDVYRDSQSLPSFCPDGNKAGRLLIDHLIQQGHRKIALLTYSHWRPGDNHFYEGVSQGLAAAGLSHDTLVMRSLPNDPLEFSHEAAVLLSEDDRPTAIICSQGIVGADAVSRSAKSLGLSVPKDLEIVFFGWGNEAWAIDQNCSYPHIHVCSSAEKHATMAFAAETIQQMHEGKNMAGKHVVLPVQLVIPKL